MNKPMNPRAIAARIVNLVTREGRSLNVSMSNTLNLLSSKDRKHLNRSLIAELCYGTIRWHEQLTAIQQQLLNKPLKTKDADVDALLLVGLYQLIYMRLPIPVSVSETVNACNSMRKPWAKKMVNGVLREFLRERDKLLVELETQPSSHYSHPKWYVDSMREAWPEQWTSILDANNHKAPMTLRVNKQRLTQHEYLALLGENHMPATVTQASTVGVTLTKPCDISTLPGFREGLVSVQDEAGQFAAELLDLQPGQRVLDACAAPGSKTSAILETQPALDTLISVEKDADRITQIVENCTRLDFISPSQHDSKPTIDSRDNAHPTQSRNHVFEYHFNEHTTHIQLHCADAAKPETWWDKKPVDRILLDAPCSCTGVIRRHPDIKVHRRPDDITAMADVQYQLLEKLWPLLKVDGILLYATCSVLPQENQLLMQRFLEQHNDAREQPIEVSWGEAVSPGRQILTGTQNMDGFYYCRVVKTLG